MTWIPVTPPEQADALLREAYQAVYALYPAEYRVEVDAGMAVLGAQPRHTRPGLRLEESEQVGVDLLRFDDRDPVRTTRVDEQLGVGYD